MTKPPEIGRELLVIEDIYVDNDRRVAEVHLVGPGRIQTVYVSNAEAIRLFPFINKQVGVIYERARHGVPAHARIVIPDGKP